MYFVDSTAELLHIREYILFLKIITDLTISFLNSSLFSSLIMKLLPGQPVYGAEPTGVFWLSVKSKWCFFLVFSTYMSTPSRTF